MFWVVKANKQTILNGADPDEVLASSPDPKCKAWWMKLNGKMAVDPGTLVNDTEIGLQTASEMMKPQEVFELDKEELVSKTKEQVNVIKKCIGNVCREQALAHRHAAEAADNLASLTWTFACESYLQHNTIIAICFVVFVLKAKFSFNIAAEAEGRKPSCEQLIAESEHGSILY